MIRALRQGSQDRKALFALATLDMHVEFNTRPHRTVIGRCCQYHIPGNSWEECNAETRKMLDCLNDYISVQPMIEFRQIHSLVVPLLGNGRCATRFTESGEDRIMPTSGRVNQETENSARNNVQPTQSPSKPSSHTISVLSNSGAQSAPIGTSSSTIGMSRKRQGSSLNPMTSVLPPQSSRSRIDHTSQSSGPLPKRQFTSRTSPGTTSKQSPATSSSALSELISWAENPERFEQELNEDST